jgi:hypothetical protein
MGGQNIKHRNEVKTNLAIRQIRKLPHSLLIKMFVVDPLDAEIYSVVQGDWNTTNRLCKK